MNIKEINEILINKTVGLACAGALGSHCAFTLARLGIGKLIIVDSESVTNSNLNNHLFFNDQVGMKKLEALKNNLLRINSDIKIVCIDENLNEQSIAFNFNECDVIVDTFEDEDSQQLLVNTVKKYLSNTPVVSSIGLSGNLKLNEIQIQKNNNIYLCGDFSTAKTIDKTYLASKIGFIANLQADTVLKILLNSN